MVMIGCEGQLQNGYIIEYSFYRTYHNKKSTKKKNTINNKWLMHGNRESRLTVVRDDSSEGNQQARNSDARY